MALNGHTELFFLFVLPYLPKSNMQLFSEKMGSKIASALQLDTKPELRLRQQPTIRALGRSAITITKWRQSMFYEGCCQPITLRDAISCARFRVARQWICRHNQLSAFLTMDQACYLRSVPITLSDKHLLGNKSNADAQKWYSGTCLKKWLFENTAPVHLVSVADKASMAKTLCRFHKKKLVKKISLREEKSCTSRFF